MWKIQYNFNTMPGIYDSESKNQVETSPSDELNAQPSNTEEDEQQTRESDQTDKINKFLLKSFLERINNHPINMPSDRNELESAESNDDWNWSIKYTMNHRHCYKKLMHFVGKSCWHYDINLINSLFFQIINLALLIELE